MFTEFLQYFGYGGELGYIDPSVDISIYQSIGKFAALAQCAIWIIGTYFLYRAIYRLFFGN